MKVVVDIEDNVWIVGNRLSSIGSQSHVYMCASDPSIVIKVYRSNVYGEYELERECLIKLRSKLVPNIVGFGKTKTNHMFILMERFDGTLRSLIGSPELDRDSACEQLVECLLTIHSSGLIHGDINSDNVFVKGSRVVLADFGRSASYNTVSAWYDKYYMIVLIVSILSGRQVSVSKAANIKQAVRERNASEIIEFIDQNVSTRGEKSIERLLV